jgi:hypothetical protein
MKSQLHVNLSVIILAAFLGSCSTCDGVLEPTSPNRSESSAVVSSSSVITPINDPRVIFETDWQFDVDDVGALAVLHGLQNEGKCTIIGVSYNEVDGNGPGSIDAVNTWYKRGNIPIGYYDKSLICSDGDKYNSHLNNNFPHTMDDNYTGSSVAMYKQVLASQPDNSVIVIRVGFLNNLNDLINDPEGYAMVKSKVKLLAVMGGLHNDDFNFVRHNLVSQTEYVISNWPGRLVTTHDGGTMYTGPIWNTSNPVATAYQLWGRSTGYQRASWDEVTTLYAITGTQWFSESWSGGGSLKNGYSWSFTDKGNTPRGYARISSGKFNQVEAEIKRLMNSPPL